MPFKNPETMRQYMKAYDAKRVNSAMRKAARTRWQKRKSEALSDGPFVAVDSEGGSTGLRIVHDPDRPGEPYTIEDSESDRAYIKRGCKVYRPHKTFLWGAGNDRRQDWLCTGRPLHTAQIADFLLTLPDLYPRSIFVSFAFYYDATQLFAGLPYEKAWEVAKADYKGNPTPGRNMNRWTYWGKYAFRFAKWKFLCVAETHPFLLDKAGRPKIIKRVMIYDVFGFFQSSFVKALKTMPGAVSNEEMALIVQGKADRATFAIDQLDFIKKYTTAELCGLCRMMTKLREGLTAQDLKIQKYWGAGSIAGAMMKKHGVTEHYPKISTDGRDVPREQIAAFHAFFGGRIELIMQGDTKKELHGYDIASAYPAISAMLPSMRGGIFRHVLKPDRSAVESANILSLVRLYSDLLPENAPFYPLPYRTRLHQIRYGMKVNGWYCAEEASAAFAWTDRFGGEIKIREMYEFIPANDEKPLGFVAEYFDWRNSLPKTDIRGQVVKLGINSVYGKCAQAIGSSFQPPKLANPYYAAAITAGTRARLLRAALLDPTAIVMLATDGIISKRPLKLFVPAAKTLGAWEYGKQANGGGFVQSGVYSLLNGPGNTTAKSRGFKPDGLETSLPDFVRIQVPKLWEVGAEEFRYRYQNLVTLGGSIATEASFATCGMWLTHERVLKLDFENGKRNRITAKRSRRSYELVPSRANSAYAFTTDEISAQRVPDWFDPAFGERREESEDEKNMHARFSEV